MTTTMKILLLMAMMLFTAVSCGGGGSPLGIAGDEEIGITSKPLAGRANLNGTLVSTGGFRAFSQAGSGLEGALVTLINTLTGGIAGVDITNGLGEYEFKGVPSGNFYLLKIEFKSTADLDGDGFPDEIELYLPIDLADQAIVELLEQIGIVDSDGDGQLDSIDVEVEINDDSGNHSQNRIRHNRRNGETRVDENNDGSFDDDVAIEDEDADGLPDASNSDDSGEHGSLQTYHELEVKGLIEAISTSSITIGGITFTLDANTSWRIGDNRNVSPAEFTIGMYVEVEGHPDGNNGWIASKVKLEDNDGDGQADDSNDATEGDEREVKGEIEAIDETSITVGGVTYVVNSATHWEFNDNDANWENFLVGDYVEVYGLSDGAGGWIAREVEMEDADHEESGHDSDDDGDDNDDDGDDNDDDGDDNDDGDDDGDDNDDDGDDNDDDGDDNDDGDDDGDDNDDDGDDNDDNDDDDDDDNDDDE